MRAGLVERAGDWRWGGAGDRGKAEPLGPPLLAMAQWPAEHALDPGHLAAVRRHAAIGGGG